MTRQRGLSARLKLTLSYAGVVLASGLLLLTVVWAFLLRYVPSVTVYVAEGYFPGRPDLIRAFAPAATMAMLFLLVVGLAGGWVLAGRMLAPLERITYVTRRVAKGSFERRIALEGRQDEFRELADAFDAMLGTVEAHVAEQRRFAANASHELRTPLAVTQTLLDVAQHSSDRDAAADLARLREMNTRAIELTEALLLLSRAGATVAEQDPFDLSLGAEEAAETLFSLASMRDVSIETSGTVAMVAGSPALLLQMTTNLVQNAVVHNLPSGGRVWVHTEQTPVAATLTVENTGPELSRELVATLTEPFVRGANRTRAEGPTGTGLGLSIVDRVVNAHRGVLALAPRQGGGLHVRVELPLVDPARAQYPVYPPA